MGPSLALLARGPLSSCAPPGDGGDDGDDDEGDGNDGDNGDGDGDYNGDDDDIDPAGDGDGDVFLVAEGRQPPRRRPRARPPR